MVKNSLNLLQFVKRKNKQELMNNKEKLILNEKKLWLLDFKIRDNRILDTLT